MASFQPAQRHKLTRTNYRVETKDASKLRTSKIRVYINDPADFKSKQTFPFQQSTPKSVKSVPTTNNETGNGRDYNLYISIEITWLKSFK